MAAAVLVQARARVEAEAMRTAAEELEMEVARAAAWASADKRCQATLRNSYPFPTEGSGRALHAPLFEWRRSCNLH